MINNNAVGAPLRVTILSDSVLQRANLKQVLKKHGSQIVHENSLGAYRPQDFATSADVVLVDLKNAGDLSLKKLETLLENNQTPILFNDGETIPTENGPVRDDWVNNLTHKLFEIANKPAQEAAKNRTLLSNNSKRVKKTPLRVTIVSKSKTRRNVLRHVLLNQGMEGVYSESLVDADIEQIRKTSDLLLLDRHNIGGEDIFTFEALKKQKLVGYIICDSSKLLLGNRTSKDRRILGTFLIKKLTSKAKLLRLNQTKITNAAVAPMFGQDPVHWADRLSIALENVRKTSPKKNSNQAATFNKMNNITKQVPIDSDWNIPESLDFSNHAIPLGSKSIESGPLQLTEIVPLEIPGEHNPETLNKGAIACNLSNSNEIEFDLEQFDSDLSTLKEVQNIFENSNNDLPTFFDVPKKKTGRKIFGIDWSNPFK